MGRMPTAAGLEATVDVVDEMDEEDSVEMEPGPCTRPLCAGMIGEGEEDEDEEEGEEEEEEEGTTEGVEEWLMVAASLCLGDALEGCASSCCICCSCVFISTLCDDEPSTDDDATVVGAVADADREADLSARTTLGGREAGTRVGSCTYPSNTSGGCWL